MKLVATNVLEQAVHKGVYGANSIFTTTFINKEGKGIRENTTI